MWLALSFIISVKKNAVILQISWRRVKLFNNFNLFTPVFLFPTNSQFS